VTWLTAHDSSVMGIGMAPTIINQNPNFLSSLPLESLLSFSYG